MLFRSLTIFIVSLMVIAWSGTASAQHDKRKPRKPAAQEATSAPAPRTTPRDPCAQYGAGFTRMPGSDTCVRIGGSVGVEGGSRF